MTDYVGYVSPDPPKRDTMGPPSDREAEEAAVLAFRARWRDERARQLEKRYSQSRTPAQSIDAFFEAHLRTWREKPLHPKWTDDVWWSEHIRRFPL